MHQETGKAIKPKNELFDLEPGACYEVRVPLSKDRMAFLQNRNTKDTTQNNTNTQPKGTPTKENTLQGNKQYQSIHKTIKDPPDSNTEVFPEEEDRDYRPEVTSEFSSKKRSPARSLRKRKVRELEPFEDGLNASHTWSELIEEALTTLGGWNSTHNTLRSNSLPGKRTGLEITSYIEDHYEEMLSNKTKTWRNSVMG